MVYRTNSNLLYKCVWCVGVSARSLSFLSKQLDLVRVKVKQRVLRNIEPDQRSEKVFGCGLFFIAKSKLRYILGRRDHPFEHHLLPGERFWHAP